MANYGTVLITGANRGLGLEFTRQLAGDADRIIATCRNPARSDELRAMAESSEGKIEVRALEVTDYSQARKLARELGNDPIDLLINNAGILGPRPGNLVQDVDAWRRVFEVNVIAPTKMVEAFADQVAASNRKLIANITSKMGSIADNTSGGAYIYRSSKAALNAVGRSMARDLADRQVTVLLLHPGWVRTDMGGPNGLIDAPTSVAGMKDILDQATLEQSGGFYNYDGASIAW
ncbi:MAG: SDR family oxidoreductase [Xanthomonadales bacterium]|nr:SDR family oxidoreductase [Xanthomonadales bacterium]